MARRSRIHIEEEDADLNLTPMLDVVFILLIFFIVTSVFVKVPGEKVETPEVVLLEEDLRIAIMVAVNDNNEVWIDKKPYGVSEIYPVLAAMRDENPAAKAIIEGDLEANAGTVMRVQEIIQSLGVSVYMSTELKE